MKVYMHCESDRHKVALKRTLFQKQLHNFERLYKFIRRAFTASSTVIMWQKTPTPPE
jgi:hypothetical protein